MSDPRLELSFGDVRAKRLQTPDDFVSHMVEHIAWRMGCAIDLQWPDDDWVSLGRTLGARIGTFAPLAPSAAALGMIDDGSAEVLVQLDAPPRLKMQTAASVDREWFLSARCEQLPSGRPLARLLEGLSHGLKAEIRIRVCSFEDPHHTWEGIFRGVGTALGRLFTPPAPPVRLPASLEKGPPGKDVAVICRSTRRAEVTRRTAESELSVTVDFQGRIPFSFRVKGAGTAAFTRTGALEGLRNLLRTVADNGGFSLQGTFRSRALDSSHVLLEDTGLVIGRALSEVLVKRMTVAGVNGAGSSLREPADFDAQSISVGVSVEGRKFWRFVPLDTTHETLRRRLIIGHTVFGGLFSEDLDDFLDGLSWGLGCSLVVHIRRLPPPEQAWGMIFQHLGRALKEVFEINPHYRGVPPGVKASLS